MNHTDIVVKSLPEYLHLRGVQELRRELEPVLKSDRPLVVFDFSRVRQMDGAGVEMLVESLESAMKRDGDIKLAAVPNELAVILELTRVDRLFEIFDTLEAAVASFDTFSASRMESATPAIVTSAEEKKSRTNGKANGHFKMVS
jgi:anti-sigma B factor antagonist